MALSGHDESRSLQTAYESLRPFVWDPFYDDWKKKLAKQDKRASKSKDPEVLAMIEACKEWKSGRDWVSAEADETQPIASVARSATFSVAQDALKPRDS
jgi:hypothetical protein